MKYRGGIIAFLAIAGLSASASAFACGDKFLVAGRGARFQRGGSHSLVVLIYAPPASYLRAGSEEKTLEKALSRAGLHPVVASTLEELGRNLKEKLPGLVVAAETDAATVQKLASPAPSGPIILPVLNHASRQELTSARKTYGVALNSPASGDALLDAIDEAVDLRAKSGKIASLKP
jgi:hypothetical protein